MVWKIRVNMREVNQKSSLLLSLSFFKIVEVNNTHQIEFKMAKQLDRKKDTNFRKSHDLYLLELCKQGLGC